MQTIEVYYDGRAFIPVVPVSIRVNERAVVTILGDITGKFPKHKGNKAYLDHAGALSDENYREIMEILEDTRTIDVNEW